MARSRTAPDRHAGDRIAAVLRRQGVDFVFTLCGGHISPILVGCKTAGIRVIDTRHEATAVFAADACARLTGRPGIAAVTAGPGLTNALTALRNARQAESPLVLLGGAAPTVLRGRGALQDIDQLEAVRSHVKRAFGVTRVRDLVPTLEEAIRVALAAPAGPTFVECPIDLLYPEALVRSWYQRDAPSGGLLGSAASWWLRRHLDEVFAPGGPARPGPVIEARPAEPAAALVRTAARWLRGALRPLVLVGAEATTRPAELEALAAALGRLGVPVYLAGAARGLLGAAHPLQLRHGRAQALRRADLVVLAGVACDFRLGYGAAIPGRTTVVSAGASLAKVFLNRIPSLPVPADPARFLVALAAARPGPGPEPAWTTWLDELRAADAARDREIAAAAGTRCPPVHPLALCRGLEAALGPDATLVADGGDFVATASYVLRPRRPLGWLDPGVFGTLGVGAGFALAAGLLRPRSETWLLWGDGAAGFSLIDLDTFVRHRVPVVAVVGNDARWSQIARDQVAHLGDEVGTRLLPTDYHRVAEGLGAVGLLLDRPGRIQPVLARARRLLRQGRQVLVDARLGISDFRKGSISV